MSDKRKNNVKIAWAKKTKMGFWSEDIGPEAFEALQKVELGGRISLKTVKCKSRDGKEFDGYVFEYLDPEVVAKIKAATPPRTKPSSDDDI